MACSGQHLPHDQVIGGAGPVAQNGALRAPTQQIRCSIVASISACHAEDPGSIPGGGGLYRLSAASALHLRRIPCGGLRRNGTQES